MMNVRADGRNHKSSELLHSHGYMYDLGGTLMNDTRTELGGRGLDVPRHGFGYE